MIMKETGQAEPEGFRYQEEVVPPDEERELAERIKELPLKEFEFQGYIAKRRTISYGWDYDFESHRLVPAEPIPAFLIRLRDRAARFADLAAEELPHALITEYRPGAGIGWHVDKAVFGDVIGISLVSPCIFRLRRKIDSTWERYSLTAQPRSAYLLRGISRIKWEHSIPDVDSLRYSVTFRTIRRRR